MLLARAQLLCRESPQPARDRTIPICQRIKFPAGEAAAAGGNGCLHPGLVLPGGLPPDQIAGKRKYAHLPKTILLEMHGAQATADDQAAPAGHRIGM